jgi:uncharacterized protein YcfL
MHKMILIVVLALLVGCASTQSKSMIEHNHSLNNFNLSVDLPE